MSLPELDSERVSEYIIKRLKWYVLEYAHAKAGVLGVSGGIDSATTAFLTVKALGRTKLFCYVLPGRATKQEDVDDALDLVKRLRVLNGHYELLPVGDIVHRLKEKLGRLSKVEEGNLTARVRMAILHQRAWRERAVVIGTGDKSELMLGYFTKYGDGGVDLLPIGGLYKTYVRQLARYLGVPERIIHKPPTPALWDGQTAEGELGIDYDTLDKILYLRFEDWLNPTEITKRLGISKEKVDRIMTMVRVTQHKRLPPEVFKIGFRDLGSDWRYPRQWA